MKLQPTLVGAREVVFKETLAAELAADYIPHSNCVYIKRQPIVTSPIGL